MSLKDKSFLVDSGLDAAVEFLRKPPSEKTDLPDRLSLSGIGEIRTLELLAPHVLGSATYLDAPSSFAHMDPPTPWITWATTLWNARLNQNLLHPATGPFAIKAERKVFEWLAPFFGMHGGHMCSGSSIANLTGIWAARDSQKIEKVVASESAHVSVEKAAKILGLAYEKVDTNSKGQINPSKLKNLQNTCLVLTAGTTSTGAVDSLDLIDQAKWTHVDAAWAGPLRLCPNYSFLLDGIDKADSIAISAHKWFFQPKDSALIMFRNPEIANSAISFGEGYLEKPNIGVQGSRGAAAIPLLATMLAWGQNGISERIEKAMALSETLTEHLVKDSNIHLWARPTTGVTLFRLKSVSTEEVCEYLPDGMFSICTLNGEKWVRSVCANPLADIELILSSIEMLSGISLRKNK